MSLVPLYDSIVTEDGALRLIALPSSTIQVVFRSDGTDADLFTDEDGLISTTNPLTADDAGRFQCWVEAGQYNLLVTPPTASSASTHPIDIGAGGSVDPTDLVHKSTNETITGRKTFTPSDVAAAISLNPLSDGYFMGFEGTVAGLVPRTKDPGTPHWFDGLTINGTMVYGDDPAPLSPPVKHIQITSTGANASYGTWNAVAFRDITTHYGRAYFYMDTNIAADVVPISYTSVMNIKIRSSDRKFEIRNSGNVAQTLDNADTKSTTALFNSTWYRLEWKIVQSTTVGTVTVKLFAGHNLTPLETRVTNGFNNGALPNAVSFGSTTAANLAGGFIRLGALAGCCLAYPGPYAGSAANMQVVTPDGFTLWEMLPGGQTIIRAGDNYHLGSGGDPKYEARRGDPVFRTNSMGVAIGPNYGLGNPFTRDDFDPTDIYMDTQNRRISARSYNLRIVNDPPDIAFERMGDPSVTLNPNQPQSASGSGAINASFWKVGQGAVWSTSSKTVTWQTGDIALTMRDPGHGLQLGGDQYASLGATHNYNIDTILSPTSCTLTELPVDSSTATTATGVNAVDSTTINVGSTTGFNAPQAGTTATGVNATDSSTINVGSTTGFGAFGYAYLGTVQFSYNAKTGTSFTGCGPHAATTGGEAIVTDRPTAWLTGTAFTYSAIGSATTLTGCSAHAATTGGEAVTQGCWRLKGFPYPDFTTGVSSGAGVMQLKAFPQAFAFKGKSTAGMNTQSGTQGVGVKFTGGTYTWTSADAGRHLLINDDTTIVGSGKDSFVVLSANETTVNGAQAGGADPFNVVSTAGFANSGKAMCGTTAFRYTGKTATSFTGTTSVPVTAGGEAVQGLTVATNVGATLVDVSYRVAGHDREQSAQPIQTPSNLTVDANAHMCNFGTSGPACMTGSVNWLFKFNQTNTLFINTTSGGYTATPQVTHFQIRSDGTWGYGDNYPAAQTAVSQGAGKNTGVTLNGPGGQITMDAANLNAGTSVGFTVTNDRIVATDLVVVNIKSGGTAASYQVCVDAVATGSFKIHLRNTSAGNLAEALVLTFAIIKGPSS